MEIETTGGNAIKIYKGSLAPSKAQTNMADFHLKHLENGDSEGARRRKLLCLFHPDDLAVFKTVAQGILEQSDCSLYYAEQEALLRDEEMIGAVLSDVSAVVLVVTSRFLFKDCAARQIALPQVKQSALPILPILMETGLEEAFNKEVSNLQCLSPLSEDLDATTVSYAQKLKNYLARILATDVDDEELRLAFDASIFLSYRKRDRGLAQRLMRLIHENGALRGVSIWYDEFLTPGEDFNQSLHDEIERSHLFIMAITPFMLEGENYVKITEYPLACSLHKRILPFMMEKTDEGEMKDIFPGVADALSAESADAVADAIAAALDALAITPVEDSAKRQYLKGVAYLKGICVEKNSEIALSLLTEAAEAGLPEALERLAMAYKEGDGVARDLSAAALWQERLLERLEADFTAAEDEPTSLLYYNALLEMADIHTKNGQYEYAVSAYKQAEAFCRTRAKGEALTLSKRRAAALELAGKTLMLASEPRRAGAECFAEALTVREEIANAAPSAENRLAVIEAHGFLATCAERCDEVVDVKQEIVLIRNLLEALDEDRMESEGEAILRRYVGACNLLSHLLIYMIPHNAALSWNLWDMAMNRAMENKRIVKRLAHAFPSRLSDMALMRTHINEGDIHADKKVPNHQRAALDAYRAAREIYDTAFPDDEDTPESLGWLYEIDAKAAMCFGYLKASGTANLIFDSLLTRIRGVLEETGLPFLQGLLYASALKAAQIKEIDKDTDAARALLEEAEALVAEGAAIPALDRMEALGLLAELCKAEWDMDGAVAHLAKKHALHLDYAYTMGRVVDYKALVASYKALISAHKLAGDFAEAKRLTAELDFLLNKYPHLNS